MSRFIQLEGRLSLTGANADKRLSPGDSVRVRMGAGAAGKALMIPEHTVVAQDRQRVVYVLTDQDEVAVRPVDLGQAAGGWVVMDPLCGRLMIKLLPPYSVAELIQFYATKGAVPVPVMAPMIRSRRRKRSCLALLQPMTCVAVVKNILNLRCGFIWTPWQLFLCLTKTTVTLSAPPAEPA